MHGSFSDRFLWPALLCALLAAGCGGKRPALYPNEALRAQGSDAAERAVDECFRLAAQYGHTSPGAKRAVGGAATGAAGGAAIGAAIGAVSGSVGRSAAYGAAGGGSWGLVGGLFRSREPDPVQQQFVDQCLRERGYQPIGWK